MPVERFDDEVRYTHLECLLQQLGLIDCTDNDDFGRWIVVHDFTNGVHAVEAGHYHIKRRCPV